MADASGRVWQSFAWMAIVVGVAGCPDNKPESSLPDLTAVGDLRAVDLHSGDLRATQDDGGDLALSDDLARQGDLAVADDLQDPAVVTDLATTDDLSTSDAFAVPDDLLAFDDLAVSDDLLVGVDDLAGSDDVTMDASAPVDLTPDASAPVDLLAPVLVPICHWTNDPLHPQIVEVPVADVAAHVGHGDPVGFATRTLRVDANAAAGGTGSADHPFVRLTEALTLARCRYRATQEVGGIELAAGLYYVSYDPTTLANNPTYDAGPLIIDFPVELRGATTVTLDGNGRPVAGYAAYDATNASYLVAKPLLAATDAQSLILTVDTSDVRIEGLVLRSSNCHLAALCPSQATVSTWGGAGIFVIRSADVEIANTVAEPGFTSAFESMGASLTLRHAYASDTEICVACLSGPGRVDVIGNRLDSGLGGVFVGPSLANVPFSLGTQAGSFSIPQFLPPADVRFDVSVDNNVLSRHTRNNNAFGVRIVAYGRDTAPLVERQVLTALVRNNRVENDDGSAGASQGLLIDSGFSDRLASTELSATLFVDAVDNVLHTVDKPVAVMTMRAQALLGGAATQWKSFGPLESATIVLQSDATYPDDFRVDHLASDPLADHSTAGGACLTDSDCSSATYRGRALPGLCNASKLCQCLPGLVDAMGTCTDPRPSSNVVVINGQVVPSGTALP